MKLPQGLYAFVTIFLLLGMAVLLSSCSKNRAPAIEGMVYIPAGEFIMGSTDVDNMGLAKEVGAKQKTFFENEKPIRNLYLKGFYIDRFEVTNKDYKLFAIKTGYPPPAHWKNSAKMAGRKNHPVSNVNWFDADSYCAWTGKRLLKEEEWEKTARGPNGNRYPWGNEFDIEKGNLNNKDTLPVGSMPKDRSYYGVYDMAGNVMEWTSSWYKPYPGSTFHLKEYGDKKKVIRGGSGIYVGHYDLYKIFSRSSYRHNSAHFDKGFDVGFRCAKDEQVL